MAASPNPEIRHAVARDVDPLSAIAAIRDLAPATATQVVAWLGGTAVLYGGLGMMALLFGVWGLEEWAIGVNSYMRVRLGAPIEIAVQNEQPAPPPKAPEPTPTAPDNTPPSPTNAAPPPQAAGASQVVTQKDDQPVNFNDFTVPTGTASSFSGGYTAPGGSGTAPVFNPNAALTGTPSGTGTGPAPPPPPVVDKSRPVRAAVRSWSCPFPAQADIAQVDSARVQVAVQVSAEGAATGASALSDPGNGFAGAAVQCAMRQRFIPALDKDGAPIASRWQGVVTFDR